MDTSVMLDGDLLGRNVGARLEVAIDPAWIDTSWEALSSGPTSTGESKHKVRYLGSRWGKSGGKESGKPDWKGKGKETEIYRSANKPGLDGEWSIWDLRPIKKRKVWGTDVYTDDSDILAMCLHSGMLRLGPDTAEESLENAVKSVYGSELSVTPKEDAPVTLRKDSNNSLLLVTVRVAPKLIQYRGCCRSGLVSRNWGNGHDGVSLMIESLSVIDRYSGKRGMKQKITQTSLSNDSTTFAASDFIPEEPLIRLPYFSDTILFSSWDGRPGLKYSPELARALLTAHLGNDPTKISLTTHDLCFETTSHRYRIAISPSPLKTLVLSISHPIAAAGRILGAAMEVEDFVWDTSSVVLATDSGDENAEQLDGLRNMFWIERTA